MQCVRLRLVRDAVEGGPYRRVVMSAGSRAGEPAALLWDGGAILGECVRSRESDPAYAGGYEGEGGKSRGQAGRAPNG
jgi:hypothetical protein